MVQSPNSASNLRDKTLSPYAPRNGETYTGRMRRAQFKKILQAKKEELLRDIDRTVHAMHDDATVFADPNDRASQEADIGVEMRHCSREAGLIKKIEEAIARIDSGSYGYCVICGAEIGLKRLEARPTATLCIDCKTAEEMRERRIAR